MNGTGDRSGEEHEPDVPAITTEVEYKAALSFLQELDPKDTRLAEVYRRRISEWEDRDYLFED